MANDPEDQIHYSPFKIVRDQREKAPWYFHDIEARKGEGGGFVVVESIVRTLKTGDYTIDGFERSLSVERKSVPDLVKCLHGKDRRRFVGAGGQLDRLSQMQSGHVVVEGGWPQIFKEADRHSYDRRTCAVTVISAVMRRYSSIHWWMFPSKRMAEIMTFRILEYGWKMHGLGLLKKDDGDDGEERPREVGKVQ